jgi:hypothetical protein
VLVWRPWARSSVVVPSRQVPSGDVLELDRRRAGRSGDESSRRSRNGCHRSRRPSTSSNRTATAPSPAYSSACARSAHTGPTCGGGPGAGWHGSTRSRVRHADRCVLAGLLRQAAARPTAKLLERDQNRNTFVMNMRVPRQRRRHRPAKDVARWRHGPVGFGRPRAPPRGEGGRGIGGSPMPRTGWADPAQPPPSRGREGPGAGMMTPPLASPWTGRHVRPPREGSLRALEAVTDEKRDASQARAKARVDGPSRPHRQLGKGTADRAGGCDGVDRVGMPAEEGLGRLR